MSTASPNARLGSECSVETRASLAVTERSALNAFTFDDVLSSLSSRFSGGTAAQVFDALWATQSCANGNPLPGVGSFAPSCRADEAAQVYQPDGNQSGGYFPIALTNRFDLMPLDGSDCGEHRMIFARNGGPGRNFIIFEARLPNPQPAAGIEGCRPVATFWAGLGAKPLVERGVALRKFFFEGLPGFSPVITPQNYGLSGGAASGQIRTNQFMDGRLWSLREFKIQQRCAGAVIDGSLDPACQLAIKQVPVAGTPGNDLLAQVSAVGDDFRNNVFLPGLSSPGLVTKDINAFDLAIPARHLDGESDAGDSPFFGRPAPAFRDPIQATLQNKGVFSATPNNPSGLTVDEAMNRAQALTCMGCHQTTAGQPVGFNQSWPNSLGFVHVSEFLDEGTDSFPMSEAMTQVFLPHRKTVLQNYLCNGPEVVAQRITLDSLFFFDSGDAVGLGDNGYEVCVTAPNTARQCTSRDFMKVSDVSTIVSGWSTSFDLAQSGSQCVDVSVRAWDRDGLNKHIAEHAIGGRQFCYDSANDTWSAGIIPVGSGRLRVDFRFSAARRNSSLGATATAQSSYFGYSPARVIDNNRSTELGGQASWSNGHTFVTDGVLPNWLDITLPAVRNIRRLELFTTSGWAIRDYDILHEDNTGALRLLAQVRDNTALQRSHIFPGFATRRVRILAVRGPGQQPQHARINEIELY